MNLTPTDAPARLFLALWPGTGLAATLAAWQAGWRWPAAGRPVAADQLHLTLHFLGAVPRERLPELMHALRGPRGPRVPFPRFELTFGEAQVWRHGVAVLQPRRVPARLLALHANLGLALQRLDLPVETRPYRPHVTLARHAVGAVAPEPPALRWSVHGYRLVESAGGRYRTLARVP